MCSWYSNSRPLLMMGHRKYFPEGQIFSRNHLPHLFHKWVGEVCEQNFARDSPLRGRGVGMVLRRWVTTVGQSDSLCYQRWRSVPGLPSKRGGEAVWRGDQKFCWNAGQLPIRPHTCADCSPLLRRLGPLHSPRWKSVPVLPPRRWRGWLERGSRMLLKRDMITADRRHARTILRRSDASNLCPLPGAVASCQILQASLPHKFQWWARQGW